MTRKYKYIVLVAIFLLFGLSPFLISYFPAKPLFIGERAYADVRKQVAFGPRIPDSISHELAISYIRDELKKSGWSSVVLKQTYNGKIAYNIMAMRNSSYPVILLGAHYDSRLVADNDPVQSNRSLSVPGANDGASGVGVLLEIARSLPKSSVATELVFFDIEDNGKLPGWDWILGSRAFVSRLDTSPKAVVILDMIGDSDLKIYKENFSDPVISNQIWDTAKKLKYDSIFINENKYSILDDHIPFLEKKIKAVDIIDIDYPHWHTTGDTIDKISTSSLQAVGDTVLKWIMDYGTCIKESTCLD